MEKDIYFWAAVATVLVFVGTVITKIYLFLGSIETELWSEGYPIRIKDFISPSYTIEGYDGKGKRIDKLLTKLLLKRHTSRIIILSGDVGTGKSYLLAKISHDLIIKSVLRGINIKRVNASSLENLQELETGATQKKGKNILLLDSLDEYHEFLEAGNAQEMEELFYKLCGVLDNYRRIIIVMRSDFCVKNKRNFDWLQRQISIFGEQGGILVTLEEPDDKQIESYYKRRLKLKRMELKRCMELIHSSGRVIGRPLFLPFVRFLPDGIDYTDRYRVYDEILKGWLKHETEKRYAFKYHITQRKLERVLNRITYLYFSQIHSKKKDIFFRFEDICIGKNACSLLKYHPKYGYYCIHSSFLEFNYIRLHYNEICKKGFKQEEGRLKNLVTFYEGCHYNRTFSQDFPKTRILLHNGCEKALSGLRAIETGSIVQIKILNSEDLLQKGFQKFLIGLFTPRFLLGMHEVNNKSLRMILHNHILKACELRLRSVAELEWFQYFPIYSLNISHTKIETLQFLKSFPKLEKLICIGNSLNSLDGLILCNNLKYLNLSNCRLESHMLTGQLPLSIRTLVISNNELSDLPFIKPLHLNYLDISDNPLYDNVENSVGIPKNVRCIYHFESYQLKLKILGGKTSECQEILHSDVVNFFAKDRFTISKNEFNSLCGLENVRFESVMIPLESAHLFANLSRPLHTERLVIVAEHIYKIGYKLNELHNVFGGLTSCELNLDGFMRLYRCCDSALDYFAFFEEKEDSIVLKRCRDTINIMDQKLWESIVNEIIHLAAICLENIQKIDSQNNKIKQQDIYPFALDFIEKCSSPLILNINAFNSLEEMPNIFRAQGKNFNDALNTILNNTKKPVNVIWSVNEKIHTEMTIK